MVTYFQLTTLTTNILKLRNLASSFDFCIICPFVIPVGMLEVRRGRVLSESNP